MKRSCYSFSLTGRWFFSTLPVTVEGGEFVVYDFIGDPAKFYRLFP